MGMVLMQPTTTRLLELTRNSWKEAKSVGRSAEMALIQALSKHVGLDLIRNNAENVKAEDARLDCYVDVKFLETPYPSSPTPSGLSRNEHLTLDVANIEKYPDSTLLFMIVDYRASDVDTAGLYLISAGKVRSIMTENPKRLYSRSSRSLKDKIRKVGISTSECAVLAFPSCDHKETVSVVKEHNAP